MTWSLDEVVVGIDQFTIVTLNIIISKILAKATSKHCDYLKSISAFPIFYHRDPEDIKVVGSLKTEPFKLKIGFDAITEGIRRNIY